MDVYVLLRMLAKQHRSMFLVTCPCWKYIQVAGTQESRILHSNQLINEVKEKIIVNNNILEKTL
ncbi:hypothetical protein ACFW35_10925 [Fictibacillus sp. NPDC058756]|uniref:hypothetical protein n=1 Tax=Fictibacillus sp. NPDC058756 TaxID=3346625 RepID=UPI0036B56D61